MIGVANRRVQSGQVFFVVVQNDRGMFEPLHNVLFCDSHGMFSLLK
jgi:hypothetical protein